MVDIILIVILLCIAGGAAYYLYRAKKRGEHCVGCPYAKQCGNAGKCSGNCNHSQNAK